jgi:hypothetical protein
MEKAFTLYLKLIYEHGSESSSITSEQSTKLLLGDSESSTNLSRSGSK